MKKSPVPPASKKPKPEPKPEPAVEGEVIHVDKVTPDDKVTPEVTPEVGGSSSPAKRQLEPERMGSPEPSASEKPKPEVIDVDAVDAEVTPEVTPEVDAEPSEATFMVAQVIIAAICVMTHHIKDSLGRGALRAAASKKAKIYLNEKGTELVGSMPLPMDTTGWNMVSNIIRLLTTMETGTVESFQKFLERSAENGVVAAPIRTVARALKHAFGDISILTLSQVWVRVSENVYSKGDLYDIAVIAETFNKWAAWSVKALKKVRKTDKVKAKKAMERQKLCKIFFETTAALIPAAFSQRTEGSLFLLPGVFNLNAHRDQRMLTMNGKGWPSQLNLNVQTPHAISYISAVYGLLHRTMAKAICAGLEWNSQQEGEEGKDRLSRTVYTLLVNALYKYAHKKGCEQIDNDFVFNAIYERLMKVKEGILPNSQARESVSGLLKVADRWEAKVSVDFPLGIPRQANTSSNSDSPVPEHQADEIDAESDYDDFSSSDDDASNDDEASAADDGNSSSDEDEASAADDGNSSSDEDEF